MSLSGSKLRLKRARVVKKEAAKAGAIKDDAKLVREKKKLVKSGSSRASRRLAKREERRVRKANRVPLPPRPCTRGEGAIVRPVFSRADLINAESAVGRTIFGPVPLGHQREFFEHSKNVWIWHERWWEKGQMKETTMRYEVRPAGVYKKLQGSEKNYVKLTGKELENFRQALHIYLALVKAKIY